MIWLGLAAAVAVGTAAAPLARGILRGMVWLLIIGLVVALLASSH